MNENTRNIAILAAVIILIGAAFYFTQPKASGGNATPTPTPATSDLAVRNGDAVLIDYTVRVENGTVYDTSLESVARGAGIFKDGLQYKPFSFTVGEGQVIPGMDEAVLGMRVGDEKTAIMPPAKAYGEYDQALLVIMPRFYSVNRTEIVPMGDFRSVFPDFDFSSQTVAIGDWNATIISATNESVTLRHDPVINQTIETGSWIEVVSDLNDTAITLRRDPVIGRQYLIRDQSGNPQVATVRDVKDDYLLLDYNPPLAGHTLNFTIKLVNVTRLSS